MTRSTLRAWVVLSRGSNLPTIATNVLAAAAVAGVTDFTQWSLLAVLGAMGCVYVAGMIFNDVCDVDHDRRVRERRPLVAGTVTIGAARGMSAVFALLGVGLVALVSSTWAGPAAAVGLVAVVAMYDLHHKANPWAPVLMGTCRGLVYMTTALALSGAASLRVVGAALLITAYVAAVTALARRPAARRPNVPWLLAGISVVDAVVLGAVGAYGAAAAAIVAVALTRLLQRVVPGD